jgi:hypothetical protein
MQFRVFMKTLFALLLAVLCFVTSSSVPALAGTPIQFDGKVTAYETVIIANVDGHLAVIRNFSLSDDDVEELGKQPYKACIAVFSAEGFDGKKIRQFTGVSSCTRLPEFRKSKEQQGMSEYLLPMQVDKSGNVQLL